MQRNRGIWIGLTLILAVGLGYLISMKFRTEESTALVVRTYNVPPERADELKNSLNHLFWHKENGDSGSAQVFGNGLILVRAPEGYQQGVRRMIEQLGSLPPAARTTIRLDYWLIVGEEDKSTNLESFAALAPVLKSIEALDGHRNFRILEHLATSSVAGDGAHIKGSVYEATSTASPLNDHISLQLDLRSRLGEVKSTTQIKDGEYLILGQSALEPGLNVGKVRVAAKSANVYYVVRAEAFK